MARHVLNSGCMDSLTSAAASGMRTSLESLDMLANNLANAQTNGYKSDREFFDLYTSMDASGNAPQMPDIPASWTDFSQGTLLPTSNALDLAISGEGMFSAQGPDGTLYTRNGSLRLSQTGQLTTPEGYPVLNTNGKPIQLDRTQPIVVSADGNILQSGAPVAQIALTAFKDPHALAKQGANYFTYAGDPQDTQPATGQLSQGKLESSNVSPAESTVRLITVMRQFEMLQKAVSIGADMNKQAVEDVASSRS